ncbi:MULTISPECIES: glycoside hydrolase family 99-like domain-containing protein [Nitrospirillum]|uniref:Glycosyl transferase family WbsX n=1 Tax=Nitrospirillum amazonense TaxID=28077 RepID=A0A560G0X7_9PROT|nr:glycoside hydrolase family 99-like domain-containing protein [Nitrospirillum amazonense]MEC4589638.1 glycoside hydrolase family 99-like domain-containing protein [Nitrospirillum amazonense]TWB27547.1 glycosyl transferase family WbsX [Nitrospirillum amazonense]
MTPPLNLRVLAFFDARFQSSGPLWQALGSGDPWARALDAYPARRHHSPLLQPGKALGRYDLADAAGAGRVVAVARATGIGGFVLDCHRFEGSYLTGAECLDVWCDDDFGLAFRWTPAPVGDPASDAAALMAAIAGFSPLLADGRQVLVVNEPYTLPDPAGTAALLRHAAVAAGLGGLYLVATAAEARGGLLDAGFDALLDPGPAQWRSCKPAELLNGYTFLQAEAGQADGGMFDDTIMSYAQFVNSRMVDRASRGKVFPRVVLDYADWPDHPLGGATLLASTSSVLYRRFLAGAMVHVAQHFPEAERLVFIDSWNHWRQRSQIEPTTQFGSTVLDETANGIRQGGYVALTRVGEPTPGRTSGVDYDAIAALCRQIEDELSAFP